VQKFFLADEFSLSVQSFLATTWKVSSKFQEYGKDLNMGPLSIMPT
jgi:hypothetical protein